MAADAPPLLERRRELLAKVETTTGTAITLAGADGTFIIYNPKFTPNVPVINRPALNTSENLQAVPGSYSATLEFEVDLFGAGASGVPSWASTFLAACNMSLSGSTYSFVTAPSTITTLTIGYNEAGRRRTMSGCMGDWSIPLKSGEPARVHFRFMGLLQADTDVALTTPTLPTTVPPRWAQSGANGLTWGAYTPRVSTAEWKAGNNIVMRQDANSTPGFRSALVVSRDPTCTIDPESVLVAAEDWYSLQLASTQAALTTVIGSASNNIVTITSPKASIRERPGGMRDQIITEGGLVLQCNRNGTNLDSDLTLAFS